MVDPCWTVSHIIPPPVAAPVPHGVVHAVKAAIPHAHRHAAHHVHHAFHAVATHPHVWIETVCRAAPLAIASAVLSVPAPMTAPMEATPPAIVQPAVTSQKSSAYAAIPVTQPALFGYAPAAAPTSPATSPIGSTLVTLPQNVAPPALTAEQILAPYTPGPLGAGGVPVVPGIPGGITQPQGSGTPVPEPSSLGVLASAVAACALLRRRRHRT
nr:PEP-CTERM sorting domain-containing protein [uncultured Rhodopila sp.]